MTQLTEIARNVWHMLKASNVLDVAVALFILLAGWIISLLLRKLLYSALKKMQLNRRLSLCLPEDEAGESRVDAERLISGIFFWFLFLLTILQAMTFVKLNEAAAPIKVFLNSVVAYLPHLFAGAALLFLAWFIASVLKYIALAAMSIFKLDEKVSNHIDTKGQDCKLSYSVASILYWLVYLCFAPAILSALKIEGITPPLQAMLNKVFVYLPHLVAAAAIAFFGLFCAGLIRRIAVRFISGLQWDVFMEKGNKKPLIEQKNLAVMLGIVVYAIIAIPVVIAALSALKIRALTNSVSLLFSRILAGAGNILGALLLLLAAYIAGKFVSRLLTQLLETFGFNHLFVKLGFSKDDPQEDGEHLTPSSVVGQLALCAIMFFAAIAALELLQFTVLAETLRCFIPFAGRLILAVIVFLAGVYLSNVATSAIRNHGFESALFGLSLRIVILFFAGAVALHTADIGGPIVQTAFTLILGALAVAAAIAFGLGGKEIAAKKLREWTEKDEQKKKNN